MLSLNKAQSAGGASQLKIKILKVHPSKLESTSHHGTPQRFKR
jgi:hypothetical protein